MRREIATATDPAAADWSDEKISGFRAGVLASQLRALGEKNPDRNVRILVAEDTRVERLLVERYLAVEGYEVTLVENGRLALDRMEAEAFDLLLTDQQMPEMTGIMLLEEVRARWPGFPAIMMTADSSQNVPIQALRAGVTDFIPKPLDRDMLLLRIHRVLRAVEAERELGRARDALAARERTLGALFENLPGMVYRCHRRSDGLFEMEFASPGAADLTGYDPEEMLPPDGEIRFEELVHPEDAAHWHRVRGTAEPEVAFTLTYRIIDRAGAERWVLEKGTVTEESRDGAVLEGFVMDVTDQKNREEKLAMAEVARRTAEAATQAQAEFLNAVSHELRSPLYHISSFAELLREGLEGRDLGDLEMIEAAAKRLKSLVNDLLDLSKLEAGKMPILPNRQDFRQVVDTTHSEAAAHLEARGLRFELEIGTVDAMAFFDSPRMVQVLVNLVSNAIRFSPKGGQILVALCDGELETGPALRVVVRDHGPGIAAGKEQMIFDKFVQAEESHADGGTGLGLAICAQIVEAHHGKIFAATHPEGGAVFTVLVPREAPA